MRTLLTSLFLLWFCYNAQAQLKFGITGGINEGTVFLTTNTFTNFYRLNSYYAGISTDFQLNSKLATEIIMSYNIRDFFMTRGETNDIIEEKNGYLNTQYLLKGHLTKKFKVFAGIEINYLVNSFGDSIYLTYPDLLSGITAGVEYSLHKRIYIKAGYHWQVLNPIQDNTFIDEYKLRNISLGMSYYLFVKDDFYGDKEAMF